MYYYKPQEAEFKAAFPAFTREVDAAGGLSCEAIVGSSMLGANNELSQGIKAELFKGTDKIAVSVEGKELSFLTRAAVESGSTEGDKWTVIRNNDKQLIALLGELDNPMRDSINVFMLNKENGMAVWSKTRGSNFGTDTPEGQSYLLDCN